MPQYTVNLSDAEDKALHVVTISAEDWINNVIHERCRIAIDEIVKDEVQRKLAAGQTINGSKDEIVLAAEVKSAAERQASIDAQMAAATNAVTQE